MNGAGPCLFLLVRWGSSHDSGSLVSIAASWAWKRETNGNETGNKSVSTAQGANSALLNAQLRKRAHASHQEPMAHWLRGRFPDAECQNKPVSVNGILTFAHKSVRHVGNYLPGESSKRILASQSLIHRHTAAGRSVKQVSGDALKPWRRAA